MGWKIKVTPVFEESFRKRRIEQIVERASKEFELVKKKRLVIRELKRLKKLGIETDKAIKLVKEQKELNLEVLRREGVIDVHTYGYLIQAIELERDKLIAEVLEPYVRWLRTEAYSCSSWDEDKILGILKRTNVLVNILKRRMKFIDYPGEQIEIAYKLEWGFNANLQFGLWLKIDYLKTLKRVRFELDSIYSWLLSILSAKSEILLEI